VVPELVVAPERVRVLVLVLVQVQALVLQPVVPVRRVLLALQPAVLRVLPAVSVLLLVG